MTNLIEHIVWDDAAAADDNNDDGDDSWFQINDNFCRV